MPARDWQFWGATLIFALALAWIFRGVLPVVGRRRKQRRGRRRVSITVGGKAVK